MWLPWPPKAKSNFPYFDSRMEPPLWKHEQRWLHGFHFQTLLQSAALPVRAKGCTALPGQTAPRALQQLLEKLLFLNHPAGEKSWAKGRQANSLEVSILISRAQYKNLFIITFSFKIDYHFWHWSSDLTISHHFKKTKLFRSQWYKRRDQIKRQITLTPRFTILGEKSWMWSFHRYSFWFLILICTSFVLLYACSY